MPKRIIPSITVVLRFGLVLALFLPLLAHAVPGIRAEDVASLGPGTGTPSAHPTSGGAAPADLSANDWAVIQETINQTQYDLTLRTAGETQTYQAINRGHNFRLTFEADALAVTPTRADSANWEWSLGLRGYGYGPNAPILPPVEVVVDANRIEYRRAGISEWYVNSAQGLKHGFNLQSPPAEVRHGPTDGEASHNWLLHIDMALETTLSPVLSDDGQAITFADISGRVVLRYSDLDVYDANGRALPSSLELISPAPRSAEPDTPDPAHGTGVSIVIDDSGAHYPLTIDPLLTEVKKLIPGDGASGDQFGFSVGLSGDTVVVGAPYHDSNGAVYIFYRNQDGEDNWGQVKKVTASDGASYDYFGASLAIDGDTLVVGAYGDESRTGSAYIFYRNQDGADNWGQVKKLPPATGEPEDWFGHSVDVSGDSVVVGAHNADIGMNDNQGLARVFQRDQGGPDNWGSVTTLTASDGAAQDLFGWAVAISGDSVVVGARGDDDLGSGSGSAYVYYRNEGGADSWGELKKLTAGDGASGDWFGDSVALDGDTLVVGAQYDNAHRGSAYVFYRNHGGADKWGQFKKLTASDAAVSDSFGCSVAVDGDTIVAGAENDDLYRGSAYTFDRNRGGADNWGEVEKLTASDGATDDYFGKSASIAGETIAVGAYYDDSRRGSAYIYGCPLPDPPSEPSPPNHATAVPVSVDLAWAPVTRAISQTVYFGTSDPPPVLDTTTSNGYSLPSLYEATEYFWQIVGHNDCGSTPGPVWDFTTCSTPVTPSLIQPADTEHTCDTTPYFEWDSVTGATSYRIQVDNNPDFSSTEINETVLDSHYTPGSPLSPDTYHWRVRAINNCGDSAWSSTQAFTIDPAPDTPSSPSPANHALGVPLDADLDWADASEAISYTIYFGTSPSPPYYGTSTSSDLALPLLAASTDYYWSVAANNDCGATASPVWDFATACVPMSISSHHPEVHAMGIGLTELISATLDDDVNAATVTSDTFAVHGHLGGLASGTFHYDAGSRTLTLDPVRDFHAGEVLHVSASSDISSIGGCPLIPYGWQFTAGIVHTRLGIRFADIGTSLTDVDEGSVAWGDADNDGDLDILLTGHDGSNPISRLYRNDGSGAFIDTGASLTGVQQGSVAWGDMDNDSDLDILLTGYDGSSPVSKLYRNDSALSFTDIGVSLTGVQQGSVALGDVDNDGDLDILLTGNDGSNPVSKVYCSDGALGFTDVGASLTGVQQGSVVWGDSDNDGDLDILLTGFTGSTPVSKVYRNDGAATFTEVAAGLTGVADSSVAWGDADNDGDLDILLTGNDGSNPVSKVYRNDGSGAFTDTGAALTGVQQGAAAWGDVDNDGDLDILLTGYDGGSPVSKVYRNDGITGFTDIAASLAGLYRSSVAWGDVDSDGDLDILLAGYDGGYPISKVYRNNAVPTLGAVAPSSGSAPAGATTYFTTTWNDPDGWQDLKQCYFHIGESPSIVGNVTLMYNALKNKLWLRSDDGSAWIGGHAPESTNTIENGQAILHCDLTTAQGSGDTLEVTWAIEFNAGYTGAKKTGLKCTDRYKAKAKGKWKGSWTVF